MKNIGGSKISKTRRKMHKQQIVSQQDPNSQTIFAIILAALYGDNSCQKSLLIMHCLNLVHRSITKNLSPPIVSLLPLLLKSSCADIASKSAVIIGAAALESIEMNEVIAHDDGIIRALLDLLTTSTGSVLRDACNAILDLSTTSVGRLRLLQFSAIEKLSVSFAQASQSLPAVLCLSKEKSGCNCHRIVFKEENITIELLHAAIILINSCTNGQLQCIPRNLGGSLAIHLKRLWKKVHRFMLHGDLLNCCQSGCYVSNIDTISLAESIFRLCLNDHQSGRYSDMNKISRSIFQEQIDFDQFISKCWEKSDLLIRGSSDISLKQDNICSTLASSVKLNEEMTVLLPSFLKNVTSCPPISSDELDILHFLDEARNYFGCPLIYQQDIRVIKTCRSGQELHYFSGKSGSCTSQDFCFLHNDEILKCQDAYNDGYTIALRGMGFRFRSVAAVVDGLSSLFGQPSVGVNMYLTPANSQGLACHSDDHCVFVCQIAGEKEWKLYPQSNPQLPRLYESTENLHNLTAEEQSNGQIKQFLLKEGDILYIPRGLPHEAHTVGDESGGLSLHLTLAIEVEPPFEWEGFTHIALDCWFKKQKESQHLSSTPLFQEIYVVSVLLFHVSIKQLGNRDPAFRKACLVGSIASTPASEGWLSMNQRETFESLITRINAESSFSDAVCHIEKAALHHEDLFERERWLQNLSKEGENMESDMSSISWGDAENVIDFCNRHNDLVQAEFAQVKYRFCSEVEFQDVEVSYKKLLDRYKEVRNQYTNGMLSLHVTDDETEN